MIYLDNCASTRPYKEVVDIMSKVMYDEYANPSALHKFGFNSEKLVKRAAEVIAKSLRVNDKEIIFTSGATESNNLAIFGVARARKRYGNHIITTSVEHSAVRKVCNFLAEEYGYDITYLPVNSNGVVKTEDVIAAIKETTVMVSVMSINNEVGSIMPINEIGKGIKEIDKNIIFHVDGVQGYMKYPVSLKYVDLYSVSGHKFHGPKGVGFLYKNNNLNIPPHIIGGGQQTGMRAGTINTPSIVGMAEAVSQRMERLDGIRNHVKGIKQYFIEKLGSIDNVTINGKEDISDFICSVCFKGIRSEVMLHALEDEEIYVSAGSSCSSHSKNVSAVLTSIGLSKEDADATIRFSFSEFNTKEEIDRVIEVLIKLVPMLRRFVRK